MNRSITRQSGLSLIELIIVTTISTILLLITTTVIVSFFQAQLQTTRLQNIRTEGENILQQLQFELRNARSLVDNGSGQICQTGMTQISFIGPDGKTYRAGVFANPADSNHAAVGIENITDGGVSIFSSPSLELIPQSQIANVATYTDYTNLAEKISLDCQTSLDSQRQYVTISFNLRSGDPTVTSSRMVWQRFIGGVLVRN